MTVSELIAKLQSMPLDLPVKFMCEDIDSCRINNEFYDGDPANPNCPIITVVELEQFTKGNLWIKSIIFATWDILMEAVFQEAG